MEGDKEPGNIIIKTTYDISLDFQDSLLPLGFLSLLSCPCFPLTLPLTAHPVGHDRQGVAEGGGGTGPERRAKTEGRSDKGPDPHPTPLSRFPTARRVPRRGREPEERGERMG